MCVAEKVCKLKVVLVELVIVLDLTVSFDLVDGVD